MNFNSAYKRAEFRRFLRNFLTDEYIENASESELDVQIYIPSRMRKIKEAHILGRDEKLELNVYEFHHDSNSDPRVTLTKEAFRILANRGEKSALAVFISKNSKNYRLSLLTIDLELDERGIVKKYSNPRRFSFLLGPNAKIHTPSVQLRDKVKDFEDLKARFSVEVVNKDFYKGISKFFHQLFEKIKLPSVTDETHKKNFIVRLIGRIIFMWFLKKKRSSSGTPIIPEEILSSGAVEKYENYYHNILEPLFFEVLNTPIEKRKDKYKTGIYECVPFLNGGLFTPKKDDYYETDSFGISKYINTLKVPNEWFEDFFEFLDTYNFTIDENMPIDVELSVDPEMLGRIFENLLAEIFPETGENARRQTGSFYTPREIVEFMVDMSLKHYLTEKTGIDEEKIGALLSYMEDVELSENEKNLIFDAVFGMKIIDPACGSGAFPMGILQKIVWILEKIDPNAELWRETVLGKLEPMSRSVIKERFDRETAQYTRKVTIIKNSIYGVDIQEIAVEIAKLRFFLSLIVDEHVDDSKPNRGIEPLPNLEFKFVCANTLIDIEDKNTVPMTLSITKELHEIMSEYFIARTNEEKESIKRKWYEKREELIKIYLDWTKSWSKTKIGIEKYLMDWEPFGDEPAEWFNPFWMFGVKDGFDIVIGNPPYVRQERIRELKPILKKQGYKTYSGTADLYVYFYEKGYDLLKEKGVLSFITSNKWMRARYGKNLRKFLKENTTIEYLIDFGGYSVFEQTVDTCITIFRRQKPSKNHLLKYVMVKNSEVNNNVISHIRKNLKTMPQEKLSLDVFVLADSQVLALKEKIENLGKPLKKWNVKIYRGILTGYNKAFIIDTETRNKILSNCRTKEESERTREIIKPVLRGRNIFKWGYKWAGEYLIVIPAGWTNRNRRDEDPEEFIMSQFSSLIRYLEQFEGKAKERYDKGDYWWELRHCDYYPEFGKEKVVWQRVTKKFSFCLVSAGIYILDSMAFMRGENIQFIIGLLNSKLADFYIKTYIHQYGNTGFLLSNQYVERFPVPPITSRNHHIAQQIENFVDKILPITRSEDYLQNPQKWEEVKKLEGEIDLLVYQLYDLNKREIELIEKNTQ